MKVDVSTRHLRLTKDQGVRYQIWLYCFLKEISISNSDMDYLLTLVYNGKSELNIFCKNQSIRNSIRKMEKQGLVLKTGKYNKTLEIHPDLKILTKPPFFLRTEILANGQEG